MFPYQNWRVPLFPSTDNHSFKQILAKLGNTTTPSVFNRKTTQFSKSGFLSFLAVILSPPLFFNSVCVQAFIIWITVVEVMVYPFVLEPVLRQASVCPPTGMFDARLFTFEQIIILTTMKLKNKI